MRVAINYWKWMYCLAFGRRVRLVDFMGANLFHTDSSPRVNEIVPSVSEEKKRA
jgi:hypothetical protein